MRSLTQGKWNVVRPVLGCLCAAGGMFAADAGLTPADAQGKYVFNLYGFVQTDFTYDFNRVDPAWEDALRPSKIPTGNNPDAFGSDGQALISVKQRYLPLRGNGAQHPSHCILDRLRGLHVF
jgi:hypothetical protein